MERLNEQAVLAVIDEIVGDGGEDLSLFLKHLSENPSDVGQLSDEQYEQLSRRFDGVLNGSKCPCGGFDKQFSDCCKMSWRIVQRSWANRDKCEQAAEKVAGAENKQESSVKDLITIGQSSDGRLMIKVHGERIPDQQILAMLHQAETHVLFNTVQAITDQVARHAAQQVVMGAMNQKSKFGMY